MERKGKQWKKKKQERSTAGEKSGARGWQQAEVTGRGVGGGGGGGDRNTRVIPANFREIALTSFSRGHIAIAARPFAPGPFYG